MPPASPVTTNVFDVSPAANSTEGETVATPVSPDEKSTRSAAAAPAVIATVTTACSPAFNSTDDGSVTVWVARTVRVSIAAALTLPATSVARARSEITAPSAVPAGMSNVNSARAFASGGNACDLDTLTAPLPVRSIVAIDKSSSASASSTTRWPGATSVSPFTVTRVMVGAVRSDTGITTLADVPTLPARSTAVATIEMESPVFAVGGMVIVNDVIAAACGGSTTRVCVNCAMPRTFNVIDATPPESCTSTATVVCWPGLIIVPVVAPVIVTTGAIASSTRMSTGSAWPICPLVSDADACTRTVDPGAASAGTWNANDSARSRAVAAVLVPASRALPVRAL